MTSRARELFSRLTASGLPAVPDEFSVTFAHQIVSPSTLGEIQTFIEVFEAVTTRRAWREAVTASRPEVMRAEKEEVCFFSAWDFHLPPGGPWQVIEFNDNGSGLLYAALINEGMYGLLSAQDRDAAVAPISAEELERRIIGMVHDEATQFFGSMPDGLFLILDDPESLQRGKFLREMEMLRDLFRRNGLAAEVGAVTDLSWSDGELRFAGKPVAFVVNRSTDFFLAGETSAAVRAAFRAGTVYIAPNPFTYATRSDKRLLEFLSQAEHDAALGIGRDERALLSAHVPATYLLHAENIDAIAEHKDQFVFKPVHSHAGRGFLPSAKVGRSRLSRLVKKGSGYIAQERVPRPEIRLDGASVWTDLRVWAYRGEVTLLSGRASMRSDLLDLSPPGGWLPTFAGKS